jgi:hypothetical protein
MLALHVEDIETMSLEECFLELHSNSLWAQERVKRGLAAEDRANVIQRLYAKRHAEFADVQYQKFDGE